MRHALDLALQDERIGRRGFFSSVAQTSGFDLPCRVVEEHDVTARIDLRQQRHCQWRNLHRRLPGHRQARYRIGRLVLGERRHDRNWIFRRRPVVVSGVSGTRPLRSGFSCDRPVIRQGDSGPAAAGRRKCVNAYRGRCQPGHASRQNRKTVWMRTTAAPGARGAEFEQRGA